MPHRIAVISDVHGNLTALEAVLADIDARDVAEVVGLGDVAGKGPRGSACVDLLRDRCDIAVRGNWDSWLGGVADAGDDGVLDWWRAELRDDQRQWLGTTANAARRRLSGLEIRFVHASSTGEFHRVFGDCDDAEFTRMFAQTDFVGSTPEPAVVVYGDLHAPFARVEDGRTLVNAGSVGNPLGVPAATYLILEGSTAPDGPAGFAWQFVRVPYDVEGEIAVAEAIGMPHADAWARELRTGVYRGHVSSYPPYE